MNMVSEFGKMEKGEGGMDGGGMMDMLKGMGAPPGGKKKFRKA